MSANQTAAALATITDEGLFERIATAVLRVADATYASVAHTGVNAAGHTIKSPVDAIGFLRNSQPLQLVLEHHTITKADGLRGKWLHDPALTKPRKRGGKPTAPAGDLVKAGQIVAEVRKESPEVQATLALTTNQEPDEELIRQVVLAGKSLGIVVDIWSRSRLCHVLDNDPTGQWIRADLLGIDQELLSADLLHRLAVKSLDANRLPDDPAAWIARPSDAALAADRGAAVTFLIAGSGRGKSVGCFGQLAKHIEQGFDGLVVPHDAIDQASSLDQAIFLALRQLHPTLSARGPPALSFALSDRVLLLVVEDINRSGKAALFVEKLLRWQPRTQKDEAFSSPRWRLLCPLWPEVITSLGDQVQQQVNALSAPYVSFTADEGRMAVVARARLIGRELSALKAAEIASALSFDPLLVALYDYASLPATDSVIGNYIARAAQRAALDTGAQTAADFHLALRQLGAALLLKRDLSPAWSDLRTFPQLTGESLQLISRMVHRGEVATLTGPFTDQRLGFRHDRIREWICVDAAVDLLKRDALPEEIIDDPFFAEILGLVALSPDTPAGFIQRLSERNPLAVFYALRRTDAKDSARVPGIIRAIGHWLDQPTTASPSNSHLRWFCLALLAETDHPEIPALVRRFPDRVTSARLARLRNGDLSGGIELCMDLEPGTGAPWRDDHIARADLRFGPNLAVALGTYLRRSDIGEPPRVGALRMAGHLANPLIADAIEESWRIDSERQEHLGDYLWASAQCCGTDAARLLKPVCDTWALLSDQRTETSQSDRERLVADHVHWAFCRWPPINAVRYLAERGRHPDLASPMQLLLHGVDHPDAVTFVVQQLAETQRQLDGTDSFSPFVLSAGDEWRRAQKRGRPMSGASRGILLKLWQPLSNELHLRQQALALWSATKVPEDLIILRATPADDPLADRVLAARLNRFDREAISALLERLQQGDHPNYWWQFGRYVWSQSLSNELERAVQGRKRSEVGSEGSDADEILSELVMRLPELEAERILVSHWKQLRYSSHFVQAALYTASDRLRALVRSSVTESAEPKKLFRHLSMHIGHRIEGRPGIAREVQVRAFAEYLQFFEPLDVRELWEACNDRGWYELRRQLIDEHPNAAQFTLTHNWTSASAKAQLDDYAQRHHYHWIDTWIDRWLETGVTWATILQTLSDWLGERRSFDALCTVAAALEYRGTRKDLVALRLLEGMPGELTSQLIEDTTYVVRRKSLN
jgi:hypothetical protein